ncbi:hypothetical protein QS257_18620 [Terrilactibacillus sp. S3-3]|nr:hypothetical protein QS257_18620 [Terrilactibacillus sp. S3-3]
MRIVRDIGKVFSANLLSVLVGIVTGFLIPAALPLTAYADLKTFTLYLSYIGILHFGFIDGIFVKYGGRRYEEIDKEELEKEKTFLLLFQAGVTVLSLLRLFVRRLDLHCAGFVDHSDQSGDFL